MPTRQHHHSHKSSKAKSPPLNSHPQPILDELDPIDISGEDGMLNPIPDSELINNIGPDQGTLPQEDIYEDKMNDLGQEMGGGLLSEADPEKPLDIPNIDIQENLDPEDHTI